MRACSGLNRSLSSRPRRRVCAADDEEGDSMVSWRVAGAWLLLVAAVPSVRAQTAALVEAVKPGDCFRYGIDMKLSGHLLIKKDSGPTKIELNATAGHDFGERVLAAEGPTAQKVVRNYETARVSIQAG